MGVNCADALSHFVSTRNECRKQKGAYAKQYGARDVYLNTMFFHGLVDGIGKAWAVPQAGLFRRQSGDTLQTDGRVLAVNRHDTARTATIAVDCHTEHGRSARSLLAFNLDGLRARCQLSDQGETR